LCPVRSLNSATAANLGQSAMTESAVVRALSSLTLEDLSPVFEL
uniref:FH2 domain-containing protein n=1 Tax=Rodentolepis nana TaxID=102285 RepID=A0A0R3TDQ3_RODNA